MTIMDVDTREERLMKARMGNLTAQDRLAWGNMSGSERDNLLKLRDVTLDLTVRLESADKLPTWVLRAIEPDHASLVGAILRTRGRS